MRPDCRSRKNISFDLCAAREAEKARLRIGRRASEEKSVHAHSCSRREPGIAETADTALSPRGPAHGGASANHQTLMQHLPNKHVQCNKADISIKSSSDRPANRGHKKSIFQDLHILSVYSCRCDRSNAIFRLTNQNQRRENAEQQNKEGGQYNGKEKGF